MDLEKPAPKPAPNPEVPKKLNNLEAAKKFAESDHKYARCGTIIYKFMEAGYSYEQSVGAAANAAWESNGCNPEQKQLNSKGQPVGPAQGIFQWEVRFNGVKDLANKRGVSPIRWMSRLIMPCGN